MTKIEALANYLEVSEEELQNNGGSNFSLRNSEYLVLTEGEADQKAAEDIKETLWAFNAEFILDTCGLYSSSNIARSLRKMQESCCESCNDFIEALINGTCGMDEFVERAINADGREQLIATYDGKEIEQDYYLIYRID